MEILHIENLSFKYPKTDKKVLDNINLKINDGDFIVVCGESGCGKTTLLKLIKKEIAPFGEKSGNIYYKGISQDELSDKISAQDIGYLLQNPDNQIVTDKVWHELSFGLENIGVSPKIMRLKVGEMASYFGIQNWFRKKTDELSGGQKQLLNLASVMVMQPKVLILDEPTGQLDPIAAADFISTLQKLNRELGLTVILVEHRLEDVFPIADKIVLMEQGQILLFDSPEKIGSQLKNINVNHKMLSALPCASRLFNSLNVDCECPITVKDGRQFLSEHFKNTFSEYEIPDYFHSDNIAIELKETWFRYEKELPDILCGINLKIYNGEIFCLLGGNGTGKTTTLNIISGLKKPYRGKVMINNKKIKDYKENELYRHLLAFLPQNPQTVFLKNTVLEDFTEILDSIECKKSVRNEKISTIAEKLSINHLLEKHPYDLSGGEQQKCALAKVLLSEPKILLLDEPTKGLDVYSKQILKNILKNLKSDGITTFIVTHDIEFAAEISDRCALFFDGDIVSEDIPIKFFSDNNFYTTAANRISRHMYHGAITSEAVSYMCKKNEV